MSSREDVFKFYNSREWRMFARMVKEKRGIANGGSVCERCGTNVKESRKLIAHHIEALNQFNIDNPLITLNEDNIEIICFRCHNEEHDRFTFKKKKKEVYIIYGPPLAGKTSLVNQMACYGDLVVDLDKIYQAISNQELYDKPNSLRFNMFKIRDSLLEQIKTRYGGWSKAFVIGGYADKIRREKLANELGAELIYCEATKEECKTRLSIDDKRNEKKWIEFIDKWFEEFVE